MMRSRIRTFLLLSLCLTPGLSTNGCGHRGSADTAPGAAKVAPGIVFVTIDTLRADHLPSYGYPRAVAPFLSGLAEESVLFDHALSNCSHTAPSHASMFTGLHPPQHRLLMNGQPLDERFATVAEALSRQGFTTSAVTTARFLDSLSQGFDHFVTPRRKFESAPWIVDQGIEQLETIDPGTPFFLWLHFFDVHEWDDEEHLDADAARALKGVAGPHGSELLAYLARAQGDPRQHLDSDDELLEMIDAYDGQILAVDRELGRFHQALEEMGRASNTVWVVAADHGEGLGNHGHKGHGEYIYQEQLHVPLLFHAPDGRWEPSRVENRVQLVDLGPTVLDLVGADFGDRYEHRLGRSLLPLLENHTEGWDGRFAFAVRRPADEVRVEERGWSPGEVFALLEGRLKVIVKVGEQNELYDLEADPYELEDLRRERRRTRRKMEQRAGTVFARLLEDGAGVGDKEIASEHIEELRALGYL